MKKVILAAALCLFLSVAAAAADPSSFSDVQGHWAQEALQAAASAGILQGSGGSALLPDAPLTGAQALTMLVRVLELELPEQASGEVWYASAQRAALAAGLLPEKEHWDLTIPLTREQAFRLLANAFQLSTTQTGCLAGFSDAGDFTSPGAWAAAGLVQAGAVEGSSGALTPQAPVTRAEFAVLLYRLTGLGQDHAIVKLERQSSVRYLGQTLNSGLAVMPAVQSVYLNDVQIAGPIVLQSADLTSLRLWDVTAPRLVLAAGSVAPSISNGAFGSIQVCPGSGDVKLSHSITPVVEIFSNGRTIELQAMQLDQLIIIGSGNTIVLDRQCSVQTLNILPGADKNTITAAGTLEDVNILGSGTTLDGTGSAKSVKTAAQQVAVLLKAEDTLVDTGLSGVTLKLDAPQVQPGGNLTATAQLRTTEGPKLCQAQWYLDGVAVKNYSNPAFCLQDGASSAFTAALEFSQTMDLSHEVALVLQYKNTITGELETLTAKATVTVQNYDAAYYKNQLKALASQVSCTYEGNFTMDYDIDYSTEVKEAFVNANDYSSPTEYLLWINRHTQKVNVFTGSAGSWTLLTTYRCATGAPSTPTPVGVTYVTYKQDGWYMGSYNVYWITRFYPNTGYAFHSRGYYPDERHIAMWPEIGYPMSAGCIRLYDDAARWIYETIPLKTTVVIY